MVPRKDGMNQINNRRTIGLQTRFRFRLRSLLRERHGGDKRIERISRVPRYFKSTTGGLPIRTNDLECEEGSEKNEGIPQKV